MGDLEAPAVLFPNNFARRLEKPVHEFTPEARAKLRSYTWPGSVRELEKVMERAAILADDRVEPEHLVLLEADASASVFTPGDGLNIRGIEPQAIEAALRKHAGNHTRTAHELGISLRTLRYRLEEYGISWRQRCQSGSDTRPTVTPASKSAHRSLRAVGAGGNRPASAANSIQEFQEPPGSSPSPK